MLFSLNRSRFAVRKLRKTKLSKRQLKAAQARERQEASNAFNQERESEFLLKNAGKVLTVIVLV